MPLRPYQARAIEACRRLIAQGTRRICVVAPTGAGKTTIFAAILASATAKGRTGLVLVHRAELLDQTQRALASAGARAEVRMIETCARRDDWPNADIVIADECHHLPSTTWSHDWPNAICLGFTATPCRADGAAMAEEYDALVEAASYSELIAAGHLVPCEVYAPSRRLTGAVAADPAEAVRAYSQGQPTIVFCSTVEASKACAESLGSDAAHIDGSTPAGERATIVGRFRDGGLRVLSNCMVATEGLDVPRATVCVLARSASHVGTYLQMVGRVLRPYEGKSHATLVDLSGAVLEHGLPTADRAYSLDGKPISPRSTIAALWQCTACGRMAERPERPCSACGAMPIPKQIKLRKSAIARVVQWQCPCGEQHYTMPLACSRCGAASPRKQAVDSDSPEQRLAYLRRQIDLCRIKGWSVYAAKHRFKGKYGVFPTDKEWRDA